LSKKIFGDKFNLMGNEKEIKVLVAMSGGVDSSVAAALLQKQGYDVVGVFFRLWKEKKGKLTDGQNSAKEIAKILNIPLKIIDVSKIFKKEIINYLLKEFKSGRTPNPCVICNPKIKFATLLKLADKLGAAYIATGHYAKIFPLPLTPSPLGRGWIPSRKTGEGNKLFEAKDKTKDQSYFLYGLNQKQLARIIFPLGEYKKTEVKKKAKSWKLPAYSQKESHDVCFVSGKLDDYLKKNLKLKKGKIVDKKGRLLGEHQGLPLYTIGQRKGINLGGSGPYYVIKKDSVKNELIIANKSSDRNLFQKKMLVKKINWINKPAKLPLIAGIRIRYGHPAARGIIESRMDSRMNTNLKSNSRECYIIEFKEPQRAIASGQSAVFYGEKGEVLGGGIIKS
jgi:tRNA-specific 2-thiouridylase